MGYMKEKRENKRIGIVAVCLSIYFVMMPFDSFPVYGLGSLLKAVAFLPLLAIIVVHRGLKIAINKVTVIYMIYILFNTLTLLYSVDMSSSLLELRRLLLNAVLIISVGGMYTEYTNEEANYLTKALIIGGIATVALTLIFSDTSSEGRLTFSVNGASQDQNYINGYMYFAFAFFVNKIIGEKKLVYGLPAVGLIIFTLMTGSRGATVALIALALMVFLFNMFNAGKMNAGVLIMAILILVAIIFGYDYIISLLPTEVAVRFTYDYIADYRGTNRNVLWRNIIDIYSNSNMFRKIFGNGYGTVPTVNTFNHLVAHNLWLDHLLSGGLIGLVVLIIMQITFIREAWKQKDPVIFSAYVGYLTMCMTLSLTNYKPLWNCMMMIMIRQIAIQNSEKEIATKKGDKL